MLHLYKPKGSFRKSECKGIQNFLYHQMFSRKTLKKMCFTKFGIVCQCLLIRIHHI